MAKRRGNGEGSIFKRKSDNLWVGRLQVGIKPDGSPKFQTFYGDTQKEVIDKMDEAKGNIRNNTYAEPNKVTVEQLLDSWLNVTIKAAVKDTTWLLYESLIKKHIIPELGGIRIMNLQTIQIQHFYNNKLESGRADGKEGGLSPQTIRHIHKIIRGALQQAIRERLIGVNVSDAVRLPKMTRAEMQTLNIEDVHKFLEVARSNRYYKRYYAAYLLELYTGLRRGELLGLRWKDVDMVNKQIKVVQQLVKVGNKHDIRELKTESSQNRVIAVPDEVIQALKEHKRIKTEEYKELGMDDLEIKRLTTEWLVFSNELGGIVQPCNFIRNFKGALKKAGLKTSIRFHDMRHTFAELSLQQGVDIKTLQSDLGHETSDTTLDRYGHVNEIMKKDAANKRSGLLKSAIK